MEWIPGTLEIRLIGVYDGYRYRAYRDIETFLDCELTSANQGKWFYAHAGGLADIQFIFEKFCRDKDYQVEASFSGSSAIIVHVRRGHKVWHFVDSYWTFRDKLKNIARFIGMEKGNSEEADDPDEQGISEEEFIRRVEKKREWFRSVSIDLLRSYNEMDCIILWKALHQFQCSILEMGGQLQMTIASTSMHLFRRKYLHRNVETSKNVNSVARNAYFASRVEVFQTAVKDALYYDINSSFPFSMTTPCPGNFLGVTRGKFPKNPKRLYISDVEVEVPDIHCSTLPMRFKGRVFFPTGKWRGWFNNIDIDLLERLGGRIHKIHETYVFDSFDDLAMYSTDIYEKKKNARDDFEKIVYKYLLNNLYGKFAECEIKQKLIIDPDCTSNKYMIMPGVWLEETKVDLPHVHVPISAHITSMSRRILYEFMAATEEFHYCDTDGFSTTGTLVTGKELGDLKLEKIIDNGYFIMPKLYMIDGLCIGGKDEWKDMEYVKAKGFSRITAERFMRLLEGDSISYERMSRLRENIRRGTAKPTESTILKRIRIKNLHDTGFNPARHVIPKRFTYPDGHTRPWHVQELQNIL